jgi:fatty acid-binding protein DegV
MLYERLSTAGQIEDVAVMHGGATDIDQFLDLIAPRLPREAIRTSTLGAVVGVHGGPHKIGVSWIAAASRISGSPTGGISQFGTGGKFGLGRRSQ